MRKKFINYIIRETKNRDLITSLEPTLEECYFLYDHDISVIKFRANFVFEPIDYSEQFDIFMYYIEK